MTKEKLFPLVYGVVSAFIAFIVAFFISQRTFHLSTPVAILAAGLFALFFFILSWFRGHASMEIKRIAHDYHLTDRELARITGMKASDFPIYHEHLQLILPKRYWPKVLDALQKYEKKRQQMKV